VSGPLSILQVSREPVVHWTNGRVPPPPPPTGGGDGPDGDPTPGRPAFDNLMLAVLFFIGAEIMFFAGLIFGFWILRLGAAVWPPPLQPRLPLAVTGINTLILLGSSALVVAAGRALATGDRRGGVRRLALATGLGALFLAIQGYEWIRLVHFGLTVTSGAYGGTFYTLIGAHGVHVFGALVWLASMTALTARAGSAAARPVGLRACATYWHFVVGLWPILFLSVYVL
jgi:heme/copper-type cytochrome/quinol oxidase subunit 3